MEETSNRLLSAWADQVSRWNHRHLNHDGDAEEAPSPAGGAGVSYLIGEMAKCAVCGRTKKPIGRDSMDNGLCSHECEGYRQAPLPSDLWPGETREAYGYPDDWREVARSLGEVPK